MNNSTHTIPLINLAFAFVPVLVALIILYHWSIKPGHALYAIMRMLIQLLLIGYLLTYIFAAENVWIILMVLMVMIIASSWIALDTLKAKRWQLYKYAIVAIALGGGMTLILVTQSVLNTEPWYKPQIIVPLAGMVFANAMNNVSLAAERLHAEIRNHVSYTDARRIAFQASMIPVINSLFAVGLVSLPGMMTGQILSGISPLIAARYQIMVMCMIFGSSAISAACFLILSRSVFEKSVE